MRGRCAYHDRLLLAVILFGADRLGA